MALNNGAAKMSALNVFRGATVSLPVSRVHWDEFEKNSFLSGKTSVAKF